MRFRELAVALVIPVGLLVGQGGRARPTVSVQVSAPDVPAGDSSSARAALERGLQVDSLVELHRRPASATPTGRGATFMVAVLVRRVGDTVSLNTRTFNVETSAIALRMSTSSSVSALGDSATAVGRRIAQALAVNRP